MVDAWQSGWFEGPGSRRCRIVYEEKGTLMHELLEYEDQHRERFRWEGDLIHGLNFTRLGNRCIAIPPEVMEEIEGFTASLPKGAGIVRNGSKVWKK